MERRALKCDILKPLNKLLKRVWIHCTNKVHAIKNADKINKNERSMQKGKLYSYPTRLQL
jgi:hypothetical protein